MIADQAIQMISQMLWQALLIGLPLFLVTLVVGVLVGIVQVATQLQEMSLSYVPKLFATVIVLVLFGPWMLRRLSAYASQMLGMIGTMGS